MPFGPKTHADYPSHPRFRFYAFSLDRSEPSHIHVAHGDKLAKYWLAPVELAHSEGFRAHEFNRVRALVIEHRITFQEAWPGGLG